jgi:hypothetical protein
MKKKIFNVARLVADMGGAATISALIGTPRTAPYRWIRHRYISSRMLEALKFHYPHLNFDDYFEEDYGNDEQDGTRNLH